ncbi:MAG: acyl-CoA dehydrogenase [Comamonas sp. SCN 67-35]|uniref:acyl-CoA dehydrogenase family protein n=1 Tax=unclassified Comamonas TaxID=2638500 RepID=UPI00086F9D6E|nr:MULTISPECIES: acyl-CoA dehydrogenase family protein [unclassified Comamonas]MBN9329807.1 acyl-CoA dehydrogenase family protein [Comamonas sp.]ODU40177.1 MAG: acyl-CoA dehydrogenase [Comamonas sp. SCN 67-35]OJW97190.1 MAG: acyl-CoA dehydrogenase [Burkholderiales bacterium 66-26]
MDTTPLTTAFPFFTEEHEMLRTSLRRFIRERVEPVAEQWEHAGFVPREVLREMGELGFLGMRYASQYGGAELDTLATAVLAEELGRSSFGGFAVTVLVHTDMASPHLWHAGSPEQKQRYLPDVIAGRKICAVAMTEADAGSDLQGMRTTARRTADGGWVLNGSKMFITNGVHGDLYFVAAKTGEASGRGRDISMFIVEKGTPGFTVARPLPKQGWLCSDTAELHFDDCRLNADALLGQEHKGFYALVKNLQNERIVLGAQSMGEAARAIELALDWVRQRKAFGATLWDQQTVRHKLAWRAAQVESMRAFIFNTAWRDTQGQQVSKEVSMIKALAGTLVNEVMYDCLQLHGGMGYIRETAIERMARDARVQAIGGGATEVMLEEVAKRL